MGIENFDMTTSLAVCVKKIESEAQKWNVELKIFQHVNGNTMCNPYTHHLLRTGRRNWLICKIKQISTNFT